MLFKTSVLFLLSVFPAFSQMPGTDAFYYTLTPRQAVVGQSVTFQAFEFNLCLYGYDVTYELLPTPISSKLTTLINMVAKRKPACATAAGYSGPLVVFDNLQAGAYRLKFDSTSDFKRDLGDTGYFEIVHPSMALSKNIPRTKSGNKMKSLGKRRIDGRETEKFSRRKE